MAFKRLIDINLPGTEKAIMRKELHKSLEKLRIQPRGYESPIGADYGLFLLRHNGIDIRIMSSGAGHEWEHVSVSTATRCPTWEEMCIVKDLFWSRSETVQQFHPRATDYVNTHEFCLHLWKKSGVDAELPPMACV